jgi:hypothetical protein
MYHTVRIYSKIQAELAPEFQAVNFQRKSNTLRPLSLLSQPPQTYQLYELQSRSTHPHQT